jgi:hypothetical protein
MCVGGVLRYRRRTSYEPDDQPPNDLDDDRMVLAMAIPSLFRDLHRRDIPVDAIA